MDVVRRLGLALQEAAGRVLTMEANEVSKMERIIEDSAGPVDVSKNNDVKELKLIRHAALM
jgi:hypothetical protein